MTTNNSEGQEVVALEPAESRITFARKNDLQKVMRKLDKSVDKAIEFLEQVMLDEEMDSKQRVDAAKFIVDRKIQISDTISKDNLSRCIAESRLLLATQAVNSKRIKDVGDSDDEEGYQTPKYCPDMILDHSAIKSM